MTRKEYTHQQWLKNHRVNEDGVIERLCSKCNIWKEESEDNFYLANKSKPEKGFSGECRICSIERAKIIQKNNPERKKIYIKKDNVRPESKARRREWSQKARDNGYYSEYFVTNPEKLKDYNKRRQHKKHNITEIQWKWCKEYFNNSCAYCGLHVSEHFQKYAGELKLFDLHKEHVDDEGSNELSNCVPSCASCNSSKRANNLEEWYNRNNPIFNQDRLIKIYKWINEDYKLHINKK